MELEGLDLARHFLFSFAICVFGTLFGLWIHTTKTGNVGISKGQVDLGVCILSARSNIEQRRAIRKSWLSDAADIETGKYSKGVAAYFFIGRESCLIHPDNRISPQACERWEPKVPENPEEVAVFSSKQKKQEDTKRHATRLVQFLYVKVLAEITVKRLGLQQIVFHSCKQQNQTVTVVLYDAVTEDEIAAASFSRQLKGQDYNGYVYRLVEEVTLPKNYEFILEVEVGEHFTWPYFSHDEDPNQHSRNSLPDFDIENSHYSLVHTQLSDKIGRVLADEIDMTSVSASSFIFSFSDTSALQQHIQLIKRRDDSWMAEMSALESSLREESLLHEDIILLDMMDTYRNLPHKVLLCHQWFQEHLSPTFVLKTDDDCYVNLPEISQNLHSMNNKDDDFIWWGNFRHHWVVERHGKWREEKYSGTTYPDFACGSGYIVSRSLSSWLASNAHVLKPLQGEDVSMGVWLAGLNVHQIQDSRWRCEDTCRNNMLTLPELSPEQVKQYWNKSHSCTKGFCNIC